jgi:hypothetical protein
MNDQTLFKRIAAVSAMLAAPVQLVFMIIVFLAIDFNTEIMADQSLMIILGNQAAEMFRWGEILDIFGFYLLLIPVVLYLRHWLRSHSPNLVNLVTVFGLGSIFFGVAGAAIRYGAMTEMMHAYAGASGAEREMFAVAFKVLIDVIFSGLGTLEVPFLGVWLLGIGLVLQRERRAFGLFTTILSIGYFGALAGGLLQIDLLIVLFTGIIVPIFPIWTIWLGIVIWRRGEQGDYGLEPAAAD